jgi:hypothetical protein
MKEIGTFSAAIMEHFSTQLQGSALLVHAQARA